VISGETLEKVNRGYGNVANDLLEAGLHLKQCENKDVEICLKKLIPTYGNEKSIKFTTKGYELGEGEEKQYFRTVMVTQLPKTVGRF
jgi:hypothetical protein